MLIFKLNDIKTAPKIIGIRKKLVIPVLTMCDGTGSTF